MQAGASFLVYVALWFAACMVALGLAVRHRAEFPPLHTGYWRFLLAPWKVTLFAVALAGMVWLGPRSGDPTWDWVDASFMSILTYVSAPWAVGALWQVARRWLAWWQAYVAACLWMFSTSWSYDLYMLIRDGRQSPSWVENMLASAILYLLAGLLWNIEWSRARGATLAFLHQDWLRTSEPRGSLRTLALALPIVLLVTALMLAVFLNIR